MNLSAIKRCEPIHQLQRVSQVWALIRPQFWRMGQFNVDVPLNKKNVWLYRRRARIDNLLQFVVLD